MLLLSRFKIYIKINTVKLMEGDVLT